MPAYLSPIGNEQQSDASGNPLAGGFIFTYTAGTSTLAATFTDAAGAIPQTNPIVLNASGLPASPIYINGGQSMKFIIQNSASVLQRTIDNIQGVNDPSFTNVSDQWIPFNGTPTFISSSSFSLAGDQTLIFQVNRRVRSTNTGGERYSTILSSIFSVGATTISVSNDSGVLDSGLTNIRYGFLSAANPSIPNIATILQNYLTGFICSTPGSSTTLTISAGQCADSTNSVYMSLATSLAKTTAAWVAGAGGALDTGTIAANTWYFVHIIRNPTTGVVDVLFSLSATAPTMPSGFTQRRLRMAWRTDSSSTWLAYTQVGNYVYINDTGIDSYSITTSRAPYTPIQGSGFASIPPVTTLASLFCATSATAAWVSSAGAPDIAPVSGGLDSTGRAVVVRTTTSGQIQVRGASAFSFSSMVTGFDFSEAIGL